MAALSDPQSPEFLEYCVQHALDDGELVKDIVEACLMSDITAVTLGERTFSPKVAAEKLFLTEDEARIVIDVCEKMIKRVGTEDEPLIASAKTDPAESSGESEVLPADVVAPVSFDDKVEEPSEKIQAEEVEERAEEIVESNYLVPVSAIEPEDKEKENIEAENALELINTSLESEDKVSEMATPKKRNDIDTSFYPEPSVSPGQSPASKPYQSPAPVAASTPTRPYSALTSGTKANLSRSVVLEPSPSRWKSQELSSPAHVPSYLRPTEAVKNRVTPATPPPEVKQPSKRPYSAGPKIVSHTLLAPTASFLAHRDTKEDKSAVTRKSTVLLDSVLSSPQGQRVTRPAPFRLSAELRPKSCVLSKEDLDILESKEKAFRSTPVPKYVREQRPITPRTVSTPKQPEQVFEPFKLVSLERHKAVEEVRRKKLEDDKVADDQARKFKALELTKDVLQGEEKKKLVAAPTTKAHEFSFKSEERQKYHREVLDPVKKAKEDQAAKEADEAARKQKEQEDIIFGNIRKTLEFKAGFLPNFAKPFKPDLTLTKPITKVETFSLATTKRLGEPTSPTPEDGALITDSNYLRASVNLAGTKKPRSPGAGGAELRRSVVHAAS